MNIALRTVPFSQIRNEQCGDWKIHPDGSLEILVTEMGNEKYEVLVAIHELVELLLCRDRGISDEIVTAFDEAYEAKRPEGDTSENGDSPSAPYHAEHGAATGIERLMASMLGVRWADYEHSINMLPAIQTGAYGPFPTSKHGYYSGPNRNLTEEERRTGVW